MATKKFIQPSPYSLQHSYHPSDFYHKEFLDNVSANVTAESHKPPVGAALFGLGRAGSIHLSNIIRNPRVKLLYIIDDITSKWQSVKDYWKLSNEIVFLTSQDSDRVYKDSKVDVLIVASPTHTHEEILTKGLEAKKDVFCEKPITAHIDSTNKVYQKAKENGKTLLAGFNRRFDPAYRTLRDRVRQGEVGHVQIVKMTGRGSPLPPIDYIKTSGGMYRDMVVHDFDICCWLLGELPIKVQATATAHIPEVKALDDFDTTVFVLTFPSGSIVIGDNSRYSCYGYDQRLEAFGAKGMIKVENERPCSSTEFHHGLEGLKYNPIFYSFPSRYRMAYAAEIEHFLDVVQKGVEPEVKSWQTYAVTKISIAAEESAKTGKTVLLDWTKDNIPENYS